MPHLCEYHKGQKRAKSSGAGVAGDCNILGYDAET